MDHWKRVHFGKDPDHLAKAWKYVLSLQVDLLMVQEAVAPPPALADKMVCHPAAGDPESWWIGKNRRWGSAIVNLGTRFEMVPIEMVPLGTPKHKKGDLTISHPGSFVVAEVTAPGLTPLVLCSAYGLLADYNAEIWGPYATTTVNRMLSDLTPLLDSKRGRRMVLGGDLNVGTQRQAGTPFARWGPMHNVTMDRFEALGLTDCLQKMAPGPLENCPCGGGDGCRHVRTQRHGNKADSLPYQTDYLFVGRGLVEAVQECKPHEDEDAWSLSDHCPVILTLDLPPIN